MFRESFLQIKNSEEPLRTLLIGSFLFYYGSFILIPTIIVWGYIIRVLRYTSDDDIEKFPDFTNWRELFHNGIRAYLIWLVFICLPLANLILIRENKAGSWEILVTFLLLLSGGGILALLVPFGLPALESYIGENVIAASSTQLTASALVFGSFNNLIISLRNDPGMYLLLLLVWYVTPVAIFRYSLTGRLRSGFNFDKIRKYLLKPYYMKIWVLFFSIWVLSYALIIFTSRDMQILVQFYAWTEEHNMSGVGDLLVELIIITVYSISFYLLLSSYSLIGSTINKIRNEDKNDD